jgi:hypothetical protein
LAGRIYPEVGPVDTVQDIRELNRLIRKQIRDPATNTREELTEFVRRSMYIWTLTQKKTPTIMTKPAMARAAKEEYTKTAKLANRILKERGIPGPRYDTKIGPGR